MQHFLIIKSSLRTAHFLLLCAQYFSVCTNIGISRTGETQMPISFSENDELQKIGGKMYTVAIFKRNKIFEITAFVCLLLLLVIYVCFTNNCRGTTQIVYAFRL